MQFREFHKEAENILAGFHNGLELNVTDQYTGSPETFSHEMIHHQIFSETLDGLLHTCVLWHWREAQAAHTSELPGIIDFNLFLLSTTRVAHEAFATYLGILALATGQEIQPYVDRLPPKYQEYFQILDSVLKRRRSSYLNFCLASALRQVTFSSKRLEILGDLQHSTFDKMKMIDGPDDRLESLMSNDDVVSFLSNDAELRNVFGAAFKFCNFVPFDVFEDDVWTDNSGLSVIERDTFERQSNKEIANRLLKISGLESSNGFDIGDITRPAFSSLGIKKMGGLPPLTGPDMAREKAIDVARDADRHKIHRDFIENLTYYKESEAFMKDFLDVLDAGLERGLDLFAVQFEKGSDFYKIKIVSDGETKLGSYMQVDFADLARIIGYLNRQTDDNDTNQVKVFVVNQGLGENWPGVGNRDDLERNILELGDAAISDSFVYFPLIYARELWTAYLLGTEGHLARIESTIASADRCENSQVSVSILQGQGDEWIPSIALAPCSSYIRYDQLVGQLKEEGRLTEIPSEKIGHKLISLVVGIWECSQSL